MAGGRVWLSPRVQDILTRVLAALNVAAGVFTCACFIYVSSTFPVRSYSSCAAAVAGIAVLGVLANALHFAAVALTWDTVCDPRALRKRIAVWEGSDASEVDSEEAAALLHDGVTGSLNADDVDGAGALGIAAAPVKSGSRCTRACAFRWTCVSLCVLLVGVTWAAGIAAMWLKAATTVDFTSRISLSGLHTDVTTYTDNQGVVHVYAADAHDAFMAQGYVHAQMRLWQMEFQRRVGAGRLCEAVGDAALDVDRTMRTLGVYEAATRVYANLLPASQAALDAYAAGVNAYIDRANSGQDGLPLEYRLLGFKPEPWTVVDSLVWAKIMSYDLSGNMDRELARYKLLSVYNLTAQRIAELIPDYDVARFPTVLSSTDVSPPYTPPAAENGGSSANAMPSYLEEVLQRARQAEQSALQRKVFERAAPDVGSCTPTTFWQSWLASLKLPRGFSGVPRALFRAHARLGASNNWVVHGNRTASGFPLLCNDPHLQLMTPSIWFLTHLNAADGSLNAIGATFPTLPGIVIGRNDFIAWGVTNTGADVQDTYIITVNPANSSEYLWEGSYVAMTVEPQTIKVKGEADVAITVRKTRHGPIITDNNFITGYNSPLALRWTTIDPSIPDTTMDAFLGVMIARSYGDFRNALRRYVAPSQNFIFADTAGNIGYQMPGYIPIRNASANHTGAWPAPGDSAAFEWVSVIDFDALPRTFNPPEGFLASANNRVTPVGFPIFITTDWDEGSDGYRAQRISDMIVAGGMRSHTKESMRSIQQDYTSYLARDIIAAANNISASVPWSDRARGLLQRLSEWDQVMRIGSQEGTLFSELYVQLATLATQETGEDYWSDFVYVYRAMLSDTQRVGGSDPACAMKQFSSCAAFVAAAFDTIASKHGLDSSGSGSAPQWGKDVHNALFKHQVLGASPLACLANRQVQHGGDDSTVNVGHWSYGDASFTQTAGPSYRHIVDLSSPDSSMFVHTVGQDGNPLSALYDTLLPLWSGGSYLNMTTALPVIASSAMRSQVLSSS